MIYLWNAIPLKLQNVHTGLVALILKSAVFAYRAVAAGDAGSTASIASSYSTLPLLFRRLWAYEGPPPPGVRGPTADGERRARLRHEVWMPPAYERLPPHGDADAAADGERRARLRHEVWALCTPLTMMFMWKVTVLARRHRHVGYGRCLVPSPPVTPLSNSSHARRLYLPRRAVAPDHAGPQRTQRRRLGPLPPHLRRDGPMRHGVRRLPLRRGRLRSGRGRGRQPLHPPHHQVHAELARATGRGHRIILDTITVSARAPSSL